MGGWAPAQTGFLLNFWLFRFLLDGESEAHVNMLELANVAQRQEECSSSIILLTPVFMVSGQAEGFVSMWHTAV